MKVSHMREKECVKERVVGGGKNEKLSRGRGKETKEDVTVTPESFLTYILLNPVNTINIEGYNSVKDFIVIHKHNK